jgi:tRNA threonylcarbamoyladenosine biosynthesis protein TsaE
MGKSDLIKDFGSEAELADFAGITAQLWRADRRYPLLVGLRGELGSGKTTWARALLRGLGHTGRVPSPTYTLLEQYTVGTLQIVHLDLYRLRSEDELANLGLRDWLAEVCSWTLVEWPERAPKLAERCDLILDFRFIGPSARSVTFTAATQAGRDAVHSTS